MKEDRLYTTNFSHTNFVLGKLFTSTKNNKNNNTNTINVYVDKNRPNYEVGSILLMLVSFVFV